MPNYYGIESLGTLSTLTSPREAGYTFQANADLNMLGFRVYAPAAASNIVCNLWESSSSKIAEAIIGTTQIDEWVEVYFNDPIALTIGETYTISCYITTNRYKANISDSTFSPFISVLNGRYTVTEGSFPSTTASAIYQIIDIIFEEPACKYYYNDALLPQVPQSLLENYPYCFIRKNESSGYYDLFFSPDPFYLVDSNSISGSNTSKPWYRVLIAGAQDALIWTYYKVSTNNLVVDSARTVLWANADIPVGSVDGTEIYFKGTVAKPEKLPYTFKYLVRSGSTIYTVTNGVVVALNATDLTADVFQTYGVDDLPEGSMLLNLADPEVLYWQDSTENLPIFIAAVSGIPPTPQAIITDVVSNTHPNVRGIASVTAEASDDVLFSVSIDAGATWWMYDNERSAWCLTTENAGMSLAVLSSLTTEVWSELLDEVTVQFKVILPNTSSYLTNIAINYDVLA